MAKKLRANFKLERNFKRRWVAALRSGKYKQTIWLLFDSENNGFCCLGVMCALRGAKLDELDQVGLPGELPNFNELFNIDSEHTEFFSEAGGRAWQVPYCGEMVYLSELNDDQRLSFKQIANIIERSVDTY